LVALKTKLSGEKNKLEQERKDLDSIIQKLLETKKYKLSLENASENFKKIEEEWVTVKFVGKGIDKFYHFYSDVDFIYLHNNFSDFLHKP